MCGIMGAIAQRDAAPVLFAGLKRLEYRGYDSAGLATIDNHAVVRVRTHGKVGTLTDKLEKHSLQGGTGIAHTRWATHGKPEERNAHPLCSDTVALVHNGIIENHAELRQQLVSAGYQFDSDTDSEVVVHLIHQARRAGMDLLAATQHVVTLLKGAYALLIMDASQPDSLIAVRQGSPLVIGVGIGEHFIASDQLALLPVVQSFMYLEEGDIAQVSRTGVTIYDPAGHVVERDVQTNTLSVTQADRGKYRHYMLKEIFEQPSAIADCLEGRLHADMSALENAIFGHGAESLLKKVKAVQIIACGTSYHAGMVARYWFEGLAGIPCQVEVASEYRYRKPVVQPGTLLVTLSQSGETADTLAALRAAKADYLASLTICNVAESTLVRESDAALLTHAGPEIGVASTKAFTTQLTALLILCVLLGRQHTLSSETEKTILNELQQLPQRVQAVLKLDEEIKVVAQRFAEKQHALFLGRGVHYPIALEGALKLKEISYIHAEAYPAGELKHGPLALVDNDMPVVVVAPKNGLVEKLKANLAEVHARGGELIVFTDAHIEASPGMTVIQVPASLENENEMIVAPILFTLPLQLLAYHVAVLRGTDVDQPRNLAKSVTVE